MTYLPALLILIIPLATFTWAIYQGKQTYSGPLSTEFTLGWILVSLALAGLLVVFFSALGF
jgi:hypothetical protein